MFAVCDVGVPRLVRCPGLMPAMQPCKESCDVISSIDLRRLHGPRSMLCRTTLTQLLMSDLSVGL